MSRRWADICWYLQIKRHISSTTYTAYIDIYIYTFYTYIHMLYIYYVVISTFQWNKNNWNTFNSALPEILKVRQEDMKYKRKVKKKFKIYILIYYTINAIFEIQTFEK